jgi:hypothetical protein
VGVALHRVTSGQRYRAGRPGNSCRFAAADDGRYEFAESSSFDECGFTIESDFTTSGPSCSGLTVRRSSYTTTTGPHPGFFSDFCEIATDLIG